MGGHVVAVGLGSALHAARPNHLLPAAYRRLVRTFLAFGQRLPAGDRATVGAALGAVLLGFGIAAIQLFPVFAHMPLSARAVSVAGGFEGATSYAIPWEHVGEFFLKNFVGQTGTGTYWGSNPIKLHSEYLGLPVIALAVFGAGAGVVDRRLRQWLAESTSFPADRSGGATPFPSALVGHHAVRERCAHRAWPSSSSLSSWHVSLGSVWSASRAG
jgi:hypothetical protein